MGADEFKDYVLGLIFYKFLSQKAQNPSDSLCLKHLQVYDVYV